VAFYRLRQKIERASFVRCVSRFTRSQLMKVSAPEHWDKMEVCPLGIDPEVFRPRRTAGGDTFTILCTGGLVLAKGQTILLAAVAALRQRGRKVRLSLVGEGPDRKALESAAARFNLGNGVTLHGSVNQDRLREFLERADAFVLPSFAEGVPVSLMEAMAMEIPCISTFVGGIPELIESGENGILVPASDPEALAVAIERLIDDPDLRLRLGRAARRKIVADYSLRINTERLASIFDRRLPVETQAARAATA
jgi:glycosyltransferase involved in cell wall biosynthesis